MKVLGALMRHQRSEVKVGGHNTDELGRNLLSYKRKVTENYRLNLTRSTHHFLNMTTAGCHSYSQFDLVKFNL